MIAAVSGGVDSAVAAARTVEAGHDVTAIHLTLSNSPLANRAGSRGCSSPEAAADARRVADLLGIPFSVWDFSPEFADLVVTDFIAEYRAGRTPNPCSRCNERIKFAALVDRALAAGFDGVVTGHYARRIARSTGDGVVYELHRAADQAKDQSYVLGVLTQARLAHAYFPLGGSRKTDVRREAAARGLRVASKPDSYDICFIPDGDTAGWLREKIGEAPGEIVDEDGTALGAHRGTYAYTIGQRKGLRLGRPAADGRPRYVVGLDPAARRVVVGPREHLRVDALTGIRPSWCEEEPAGEFAATVQVRAHGEEYPCTVRLVPGGEVGGGGPGIEIALEAPIYGVAPGQTAVLYDGTRVIGSATIATTKGVVDTGGDPCA